MAKWEVRGSNGFKRWEVVSLESPGLRVGNLSYDEAQAVRARLESIFSSVPKLGKVG